MAANVSPIYSRTPDIQWVGAMTAALAAKDVTTGTLGTNVYAVWTADATEGGFIREVRIKADPVNNTAATVARIYINNGSTIATASNSIFLTEIGLPAVTASATAAQPDFIIPLNLPVPAGYKILLTFGTAPGGSGQLELLRVPIPSGLGNNELNRCAT